MLAIGRYQELTVDRLTPQGAMLTDGDEQVLLPRGQEPDKLEAGMRIIAFVYADSEDLPIATLTAPLGEEGDIVCLTCVDTNEHGAFLDMGLPKDLFCPWRRQHERMEVGRRYVVRIQLDERVRRLVATSRIADDFSDSPPKMELGDPVNAIVYAFHPLGVRVAVDSKYAGMIYRDDMPLHLGLGDAVEGYVKEVREDGRIDVSLRRPGRRGDFDDKTDLMSVLTANGGFLALHDKSPPADIARELGMSKKAFKRAVGALYKARVIELVDGGIRLVPTR